MLEPLHLRCKHLARMCGELPNDLRIDAALAHMGKCVVLRPGVGALAIAVFIPGVSQSGQL